MIIIKKEFDFSQSKYIDIAIKDNILTLKRYKATGVAGEDGKYNSEAYVITDSQDFNLTNIFEAFTRFEIFIDKTDKFSKVFTADEFLNSRDGWTVISNFYDLTQETVIIYFGAAIEDYLIITYSPATSSEQYSVRNSNEFPSNIINHYYPNYQQKLELRSAKRDLLESLDPNQSLAYIEAQLDTVTKAFFAVLEANPNLKSAVITAFPEFANFASELDATSVFNVKSAADCLAEISKTKTKVRRLQTAYYAVKQQNQ